MIADALTKCLSAAWQRLERFLQTSSWRLADVPGFMSPKSRNKLGLYDLEDALPREQGANVGVVGVLLESHCEDVLRTSVCSARSS